MLSCILGILVALIVLAFVAFKLLVAFVGDADIKLQIDKKTTAVKVAEEDGRVDFEITVPYTNVGKQEGTILDTYMRIYLPDEQYDDVLLRGKVNLEKVRREDDYFEAVLVPAHTGQNLVLRFEAYARHGKTIAEAMANIPDVDVALYADCRGRGPLFTVKEYLTLTAEEMRALVK